MELLFTLDPLTIVQLVLTIFLPIGVGLVTTRTTSGAVKAWLLATFTLVASMLTQLAQALTNGNPFDIGLALIATIPMFAIAVSTYYGLWKPTGVAGAAQDNTVTTLVK